MFQGYRHSVELKKYICEIQNGVKTSELMADTSQNDDDRLIEKRGVREKQSERCRTKAITKNQLDSP